MLEQDPGLLGYRNHLGQSAILLAKYHRQDRAVELLASKQPDLTLHEAAAIGAAERVRQLVSARGRLIDSHSKDGFTALGLAAYFGQVEVVEFLINQGANLDLTAGNSMMVAPLHQAVAAGHEAVVRLLVEAGADLDVRGQQGWTPLHAAARNGNTEMVRLLIGKGADRGARTAGGQSAFDIALTHGHAAAAMALE